MHPLGGSSLSNFAGEVTGKSENRRRTPGNIPRGKEQVRDTSYNVTLKKYYSERRSCDGEEDESGLYYYRPRRDDEKRKLLRRRAIVQSRLPIRND